MALPSSLMILRSLAISSKSDKNKTQEPISHQNRLLGLKAFISQANGNILSYSHTKSPCRAR